MNKVILMGRLTRDPEVRYTQTNNTLVASFSLAVNRWDTKTKSEITDWFNVEFWDKQAEVAGEYVKKGRQVALDGKLVVSSWTTPQGENRTRYLIRGINLRLLGSKADS